MRNLLPGIAAVLWAGTLSLAGERVGIVTGPAAPEIEQFAARELTEQFGQLFHDVEIASSTAVPADASQLVLVGSPRTNPAVESVMGAAWPDGDEQTIVVKSIELDGRPGVVVGGGSPAATLWAVYELCHRCGTRFLLLSDSFPSQKRPLELRGFDVALQPAVRTRAWRTGDDLPIGASAWGVEDYKRLLGQLAKLKFNHLTLSVYPWQPFVDYELGTVQKQTATLWRGRRFRVDGDTPGKKAFGHSRYFENPDLAGRSSHQPLTEAGVSHLRGVIDAAHELGMTVGLSISLFEFPKEFEAVLPEARVVADSNDLAVLPGPALGPNDPKLKEFVATKVRAYLKLYPAVDVLEFRLATLPDWNVHASQAWDELVRRCGLDERTLATLLMQTSEGDGIPAGSGTESRIKSTITAIAFVHALVDEPDLLARPGGGRVNIALSGISPALSPILDQLAPADAAVVHFADQSIPRLVENQSLLKKVGTDLARHSIALNLQSPSVGVLPQSTLGGLGTLMDELRKQRWGGLTLCSGMPAEQDLPVYFVSRSAWDANVTPDSSHREFWTELTSNDAASDRLRRGWQHLEQATKLIDANAAAFADPDSGLMLRPGQPGPSPDWWNDVENHYTQWMIELYRAHGAAETRGRPLLFYSAKRSEFALEYLTAMKEFHHAAADRNRESIDQAVEHLGAAVESTYNAMTAVADVAHHQSDSGLIAVLNEYAYRPLLAELERLDELADD